jgi:hypothetical protein
MWIGWTWRILGKVTCIQRTYDIFILFCLFTMTDHTDSSSFTCSLYNNRQLLNEYPIHKLDVVWVSMLICHLIRSGSLAIWNILFKNSRRIHEILYMMYWSNQWHISRWQRKYVILICAFFPSLPFIAIIFVPIVGGHPFWFTYSRFHLLCVFSVLLPVNRW